MFPQRDGKTVMQGVSCYVDSGSFVAVIGASGAGKSTLLDILARRKIKGILNVSTCITDGLFQVIADFLLGSVGGGRHVKPTASLQSHWITLRALPDSSDPLTLCHLHWVLQGNVYVNGSEIDDNTFKEIASYMPQEDVFSATATPREALMFIANLKLPPSMPAE